MSNYFTKITALVTLVCASHTLQAQTATAPLEMGNYQVTFGAGCNKPFMQSTNNNNLKLAFGYNQGCIGPPYTQESIWFLMDPARIGVGVSSPSYQLHLSQNSAGKPGSSTWTVTSDARFKQDVRPYAEGLSTIRAINPVYFHYNAASGYDTKPEYVGVLAQELQRVAPYMVKQEVREEANGAKTDYLSVDFGAMDFMLINAVKELDQQVLASQAENAALREELATMRADIAQLKTAGTAQPKATDLRISPNPITSEAVLHYTLPSGVRTASVQVISVTGEVVATIALANMVEGTTTIKSEQFAAGTYIAKLVADGKTLASQRLVVQH
jgi:trimeric autotransporter adhesin